MWSWGLDAGGGRQVGNESSSRPVAHAVVDGVHETVKRPEWATSVSTSRVQDLDMVTSAGAASDAVVNEGSAVPVSWKAACASGAAPRQTAPMSRPTTNGRRTITPGACAGPVTRPP